jgi:hypothetical protein
MDPPLWKSGGAATSGFMIARTPGAEPHSRTNRAGRPSRRSARSPSVRSDRQDPGTEGPRDFWFAAERAATAQLQATRRYAIGGANHPEAQESSVTLNLRTG